MIKEATLKKFKKLNSGDVMGVVRTLFPNIEIETNLSNRKKKK
jgi:hypothetical protein